MSGPVPPYARGSWSGEMNSCNRRRVSDPEDSWMRVLVDALVCVCVNRGDREGVLQGTLERMGRV